MTDTCTLTATDGPETPVVPCDEPAIASVIFACPHEHVDPALACAGCAVEIQQCEDLLVCPRCEDGPLPHACRVAVKIRWLTGKTPAGA